MSGKAQPQEMAPVLLAKYGVEERKGGVGWARRRSPCKAQRIANGFFPNRLFVPAPVKLKVDGGDAMKDKRATEEGSQRTGGDESRCAWPQVLENIPRVSRLENAAPNEGCDITVPRRSPRTRALYFFPHPAASDNGDGVSSLWLREYSSDKENIRFKKTTRTENERQTEHFFA